MDCRPALSPSPRLVIAGSLALVLGAGLVPWGVSTAAAVILEEEEDECGDYGRHEPTLPLRDDVVSTPVDTPLWVWVLDNDGDPEGCGDYMDVEVATGPSHGQAFVSFMKDDEVLLGNPTYSDVMAGRIGRAIRYVPEPGFSGIDTFTYSYSDNDIDAPDATATVTVTVGSTGTDPDLVVVPDTPDSPTVVVPPLVPPPVVVPPVIPPPVVVPPVDAPPVTFAPVVAPVPPAPPAPAPPAPAPPAPAPPTAEATPPLSSELPVEVPVAVPPSVAVSVAPTTRLGAGAHRFVSGTAPAGSSVVLYGYTPPSRTYAPVDTVTAAPDGRWSLWVRPSSSSRYYVRAGGEDSASFVMQVVPRLTMSISRVDTRTLSFSGVADGAAEGSRVNVYRSTSRGRVLVGWATTGADGSWSYPRTFTGSGTFSFTAVIPSHDRTLNVVSAPKRARVT